MRNEKAHHCAAGDMVMRVRWRIHAGTEWLFQQFEFLQQFQRVEQFEFFKQFERLQ